MINDLADLYRQVIVEHSLHPRNHRVIDDGASQTEGVNPLCGDEITVYLQVVDEVIADVSFQAHGCAISIASASLMTEALTGRTRAEAVDLFNDVHGMLTTTVTSEGGPTETIGKLSALSGVGAYPMRVKCATLAWYTLLEGLEVERRPTATLGHGK